MMIFSSKCVQAVLITVLLRITIFQVESAFSSSSAAKVQRTQAMRVPSFNPELKPIKTRPVSLISSSSSSSSSSTKFTVSHRSAPEVKQSATQHEATHQEPLLEGRSSQVSVIDSSRFVDPMAMTQNEHVDTARDGFFARLRNRVLQYGSVAAIGVGGGLAAKELLNHYENNNNNNLTKPINATQNLSNQTNSDDVSNPF